MTNSGSTQYMTVTKTLFIGSWSLFVLTLFPFSLQKVYAIEWAFTVIAIVAVAATIYSMYREDTWPRACVALAVLVLIAYIVYWILLSGKVEQNKPELTLGGLFLHLIQDVLDVTKQRLSTGALWSATRTIYFDFVMPILQISLVLLIGHKFRNSTTVDSSK